MAANLAPVYLDNERVTLQGDPKPKVAKIVEAGGRRPDKVQVVRLKSQTDFEGKPVRLEDVIDRTLQSNNPVYLKCVDKENPASAGTARGKQKEWRAPTSGGTGSASAGPAEIPEEESYPTFGEKASAEEGSGEPMEEEEHSD